MTYAYLALVILAFFQISYIITINNFIIINKWGGAGGSMYRKGSIEQTVKGKTTITVT